MKKKELHINTAILDIVTLPNKNIRLIIEEVDNNKSCTEIYIQNFRIQDWRKDSINGELLVDWNNK